MKAYKILIVIVIVLAGILGVKMYVSNQPTKYSSEDIRDLMESTEKIDNNNYMIKIKKSDGRLEEHYVKGNKKVIRTEEITNGQKQIYTNVIDYDKQTAKIYTEFADGKKVYMTRPWKVGKITIKEDIYSQKINDIATKYVYEKTTNYQRKKMHCY